MCAEIQKARTFHLPGVNAKACDEMSPSSYRSHANAKYKWGHCQQTPTEKKLLKNCYSGTIGINMTNVDTYSRKYCFCLMSSVNITKQNSIWFYCTGVAAGIQYQISQSLAKYLVLQYLQR